MKKITGIVFIIVILLGIANQYFAQAYFPIPPNNISCDTNSLNLIYDQANELRNSNIDSSIKLSLQILQCTEFLLNDTNNKIKLYANKKINDIYSQLGESYGYKKDTIHAFHFLDKSLKGYINQSDKWGQALSYSLIGWIYLGEEKYNLSLDNYFIALKIREEINDKIEIAWYYDRIADVYYYSKDYDRSLEFYQKSKKIYEVLNDSLYLANNIGNIGMIYSKKGEYERAIPYYVTSIQIHDRLNNKSGINWNIERLDQDYLYYKEIKQFQSYLNDVLRLSENCLISKSWSFKRLGDDYYNSKDYDKSLEYYQKASYLHKKINDSLNYAWDIGNIGMNFSKKGEYKRAIPYYISAMQIHKNLNNNEGILWIYNEIEDVIEIKLQNKYDYSKFSMQDYLGELLFESRMKNCLIIEALSLAELGNIYYTNRAHDKSMKAFEDAKKINEILKDTLHYILNEASIANIYSAKQEYKNAIELQEKCNIFFENSKDTLNMILILNNLAKSYLKFGNYDRSYSLLLNSLKISEKTNNIQWIANNYLLLGEYYLINGNISLAINSNNIAINNYEKINDSLCIALCYHNIGNIKLNSKQYSVALEYIYKALKTYEVISDSSKTFQTYVQLSFLYSKLEKSDSSDYKLKYESRLKSEEFFNKALEYSKHYNINEKSLFNYTNDFYNSIGKSKAIIDFFLNKKVELEKSLKISNNKVSDLQTENTIKSLELERNKLKLENKAKDLSNTKKLLKIEKIEKEFYKYRDSLKQQALTVKDQDLQLSEKAKRQQQDSIIIHKLNEKNLAQTIKEKNHNIFRNRVISILIIIIIIIVSILLYKNLKRKKEKENEKLKRNEAELKVIKFEIEKENESLKRNEAESKLKAIETEMKLLQIKLNPHIINNYLDFINNQYVEKNDFINTSFYIRELQSYLTWILEISDKKEIYLSEEIKIANNYINLLKKVCKVDADFKWNFKSDLETEAILMPPLIFQPIVENAFKYAYQGIAHPKLEIEFKLMEEMLYCSIIDNGIGFNNLKRKSYPNGKKMGLNIVNDRINNINIEKQSNGYFKIETIMDEANEIILGTKAELLFPISYDY